MTGISAIPQDERRLLAAAERRIGLFILALIPMGAAVALFFWTPMISGAFAVGGALAYGNYRWLVSVVDALVRAQTAKPGTGTYIKLFAPPVLLAVILYVIFSVSSASFAGVVSGVLLMVPAVFLEGVVQAVLAFRK